MSAVNDGSIISCSFGEVPIPLDILPTHRVNLDEVPGGNMMDFTPFVNIIDFAICTSIANPLVLAMLILTGQQKAPCTPITVSPWSPSSFKVQIDGMPAILTSSQTMCVWAGDISIDAAFAFNVTIS